MKDEGRSGLATSVFGIAGQIGFCGCFGAPLERGLDGGTMFGRRS